MSYCTVLDTVVIYGDYVCCCVVFVSQVGVFVFGVMWCELLMTPAISCLLWSSVGHGGSVLVAISLATT